MRHSDGLLKASPSVLVSLVSFFVPHHEWDVADGPSYREPSSSSLRSEGKAKGSSPEGMLLYSQRPIISNNSDEPDEQRRSTPKLPLSPHDYRKLSRRIGRRIPRIPDPNEVLDHE